MKQLFIVDDDIDIGNLLEEALTKEGYAVARAYSGTEAVLYLAQNTPDLMLLDLMLPGLSGEDVLEKASGVPTIVVSAKGETSDKVSLLMAGACDYITKPFSVSELVARVAVRLREHEGCAKMLRGGGIELDTTARQVCVAGEEIKLTRTEFALLKTLMQHPNAVVTKSALLDRIALDTPDCTEASLKMHISNLRKKLKAADSDPVEAIWGIGFRFRN